MKEESHPRQGMTENEGMIKENYTSSTIKFSPCPAGCTPVRIFVKDEQFSEIQRLKIDLSAQIKTWLDDDIERYQIAEEEKPVSCCGCHHNSVINYGITGEWKPYCDHPSGSQEIPPSRNNDAPEWCPYRKSRRGSEAYNRVLVTHCPNGVDVIGEAPKDWTAKMIEEYHAYELKKHNEWK